MGAAGGGGATQGWGGGGQGVEGGGAGAWAEAGAGYDSYFLSVDATIDVSAEDSVASEVRGRRDAAAAREASGLGVEQEVCQTERPLYFCTSKLSEASKLSTDTHTEKEQEVCQTERPLYFCASKASKLSTDTHMRRCCACSNVSVCWRMLTYAYADVC